jgi:hypothetical protein
MAMTIVQGQAAIHTAAGRQFHILAPTNFMDGDTRVATDSISMPLSWTATATVNDLSRLHRVWLEL